SFSRLHSPPSPPLFPYTTLFRSSGAGDTNVADFERAERVTGARSEYCHPVPRISKYRRHSASAQQKKHPSVGPPLSTVTVITPRSEEHTSELQSRSDLVCRLLLE